MVEIGRDWCAYLKGIQSLELPRSLKRIGNCAFYECTELEKVILPESLTAIWGKAFRYCRSLREITIPSKVWHITDDVFDDFRHSKRSLSAPKSWKICIVSLKAAKSSRKHEGRGSSRSGERLLRLYGGLLFQLLQAFPVVDLLGFMDDLPEGDSPAVKKSMKPSQNPGLCVCWNLNSGDCIHRIHSRYSRRESGRPVFRPDRTAVWFRHHCLRSRDDCAVWYHPGLRNLRGACPSSRR